MMDGIPFWLSAYPNEGVLDYFGFRFYRQPLRVYLVRGAAANDFKNAKTLIYYAAITYGFRKEHGIDLESDLTQEQIELWKDWYKIANYLFTVNRYVKYGDVPDRGFTGAIEEGRNYFQKFYNSSWGKFNIKSTFSRIYPDQREWGYLKQFWGAPLKYFRCVLDISFCTPGEYGEDCYYLLSSYDNWDTFVKILKTGIINRSELDAIKPIIENKELNATEKDLARKIIFDEKNITSGENDEYKKNYQLLLNLHHKGIEGFYPESDIDYTMLFSYAQLKNLSLGDNDLSWKILVSSITFEIGINRLFTFIGKISQNGVVEISKLMEELDRLTESWMQKNGFSGELNRVIEQWKKKYLKDIFSYDALFKRMLDYKKLDCLIDGLLQGYLISKVQLTPEEKNSELFLVLTDDYHYFVPQPFFSNNNISLNLDFKEFIFQIAIWLIDEQFIFSIDRMNYGQKAKFILRKSEASDQYIFQIDVREFHENRGIIDLIDSCLNLWKTAGIYE